MKIYLITPFPDVIHSFMNSSMLKKAQENNLIDYCVLNLFDYADMPHKNIDDYPFGGGNGMVMKPEPIFRAFDSINDDNKISNVIFPTPDGKIFNQNEAKKHLNSESLVFICGHYKGIDQRVRDTLVTHEYSIGDYIITGGELSSLVILDSIVRLVPGVLNNIQSAKTDSFSSLLLDGPHYTRPEVFEGMKTPQILLSGHHKKIYEWNKLQRENKTRERRPDLWEKYISHIEKME